MSVIHFLGRFLIITAGLIIFSFPLISQTVLHIPVNDNICPPYMGAYEGYLATNSNVAFADWQHRREVWAEETIGLGATNWDGITNTYWLWDTWSNWVSTTGGRMIFAVALGPSNVTNLLANGASGMYTNDYTSLAETLTNNGFGNSIIRLGWEFNTKGRPWTVTTVADATNYAAYFQKTVIAMKAVAPQLTFVWNPANAETGWNNQIYTNAFPANVGGTNIVDYVGVDVYDDWANNYQNNPETNGGTQPLQAQQTAWVGYTNSSDYGLNYWVNLAATNGKPLAFPEWGIVINTNNLGVGGGDDPYFIQQMYNYMQEPTNNVYFASYEDEDSSRTNGAMRGPGADSIISNVHLPYDPCQAPNSQALFLRLFSTYGQVYGGAYFSLGLRTDGNLYGWGLNNGSELGLGNGSTNTYLSPQLIPGVSNVIAASAGNNHCLAIEGDGSLWAWGSNPYGQLGDGSENTTNSPQKIMDSGFVSVAAGGGHSLALDVDGKVWAWGNNNYGQLGNGTNGTVSLTPGELTNFTKPVVAIAAGQYQSYAITSDGNVWAWGHNNYGQLGIGSTTDYDTPQKVTTLTNQVVVAVTGAAWSAAALDSLGNVWTWGLGSAGQLGNNSWNNQSSPVKAQVSGISSISCNCDGYHVVALDTNNVVWAWGANGNGQLGNGMTNATGNNIPVKADMTNMISAAVVAAGGVHSLAISGDAYGTAWGWGLNSFGEIGNNTTNQSTAPTNDSFYLQTSP